MLGRPQHPLTTAATGAVMVQNAGPEEGCSGPRPGEGATAGVTSFVRPPARRAVALQLAYVGVAGVRKRPCKYTPPRGRLAIGSKALLRRLAAL